MTAWTSPRAQGLEPEVGAAIAGLTASRPQERLGPRGARTAALIQSARRTRATVALDQVAVKRVSRGVGSVDERLGDLDGALDEQLELGVRPIEEK